MPPLLGLLLPMLDSPDDHTRLGAVETVVQASCAARIWILHVFSLP